MAEMHEIEYKIFGDDMQFVEVELDPGEATVAWLGSSSTSTNCISSPKIL